MRKLLFITVALWGTLFANAQTTPPDLPLDKETGLAKWEGVVEETGVAKDELYDRAVAWINVFFKNPVGVMKKQDKAGGEIEGKARFALKEKDKKGNVVAGGGIVEFTFTLKFKEGKYRFEIMRVHWIQASYYDVSRWSDKTQTHYNEAQYNFYLEQTIEYMENLIEDLGDGMKKSTAQKNSDW